MHRLVLIALVVSACGSETDDRPATLDYITETILAPSCAAAECHSAFKQAVGDQFDVPAAARRSIVANSLVVYPDDAADPSGAYLIRALRVGVPSVLDKNGGNVRMPYDAAMSLFYTLRQGAHPVIEAAEEFPTASRAYAAIEQATRTALASTFFSVALRLTDATTVDEVHDIINRVWANSGAPRLRSALVDVVSACDTNA